MSTDALYRRLVQRETHSSRSTIAIVLAVILMVVLAWIGTESVVAALGQPALLVAPADAVEAALATASGPVGAVVAGAVIVAIVGLVLIVVALAPGRRGRRGASSDRTAAVVDDRVIAQRLAQTASYAGEVASDQVKVSVGRTTLDVAVTRESGRSVDTAGIQSAVDAELASYDYSPALRAKVRVSDKGSNR